MNPLPLRPPFIALALIGASAMIDRFLPLPFLPAGIRPIGGLFIILGLTSAGWGIRTFRRRGTTHHPFETPTHFVCDGPYRFTRNPMYLGVVFVLTGIALAVARSAYLLSPVLFYLVIDRRQIPYEEHLLEDIFGREYQSYRERVRRWI